MKPSPIEVPDGWEVESSAGFGPFTSLMRLRRPDGSSVTWTSRSHRKELDEPGVPTRTWWIAVLFCIGSTCFTVGPMPGGEQVVGAEWVARTFFVGSIFFTSAAALCFAEAAGAPDHLRTDPATGDPLRRSGPFHRLSWRPRSIDWWATIVQLVGTVWFNVMTFRSMVENWSSSDVNRVVWGPDVIGSICFLVASYLAWAEVCHSAGRLRVHDLSWWIVVLNLLGSIFFGLSALGAYTLPSGEAANLWLDNAGTIAGGVCFFVAAAMLVPEARRTPASA